jgi:hypothetical protein
MDLSRIVQRMQQLLLDNLPNPIALDEPDIELGREARNLLVRYLDEATAWQQETGDRLNQSELGRALLDADPNLKVALILDAFDLALHHCRSSWAHHLDPGYQEYKRIRRLWTVLQELLHPPLPFTNTDIVLTLHRIADIVRSGGYFRTYVGFLRYFEKHLADRAPDPDIRTALLRLQEAFGQKTGWHGAGYLYAEDRKALALVARLGAGIPEDVVELDRRDDWGALAGAALDELSGPDRERWLDLLRHAKSPIGTRPSKVWLSSARRRIDPCDESRFVELAVQWLGFLNVPSRATTYSNGTPWPVPSAVICEGNADVLKGLIWCCTLVDDEQIAHALVDAAEACFKKIPNVGARSVKVANACVYALGAMTGMSGVTQLSRLAQRVKLPSARKTVESALEATARRNGLTRDDLEEMAVPTFGLQDRALQREIGSYVAEIRVAGASQVDLSWHTPERKALRSEPAEVKRAFPEDRKQIKRLVDDLRSTIGAQRDRLERLLLAERAWELPTWRARYLDHPLVGMLARRLIWSFEGSDRSALGAWLDGRIVDVDGRPLEWLGDETRVRLWHPIGTDPQMVLAWRRWLEQHEVTQPFKQAHREIYVLTDAELATETYSNRFAAHILRQHQLHALCQQRGWRYRLQGNFDSASVPTLILPRWNLCAEYWCNTVDGDGPMSGSGIFLYVTTDQVRFTRIGERGSVPLADVPALVFSEVMRDVDLFVGVCSVGNDPNWADRGTGHYGTYWESYAFGDLSASAETRRSVLERLLPRLTKIAARCTLSDKFLVVRGDLRTYKIHLGSGNILMEPNNQYLCIVPRGGGEVGTDRLFLPFEGDTVLSLILSKAFLLANDRAIKDPTITRQIAL